MLTAISDVLSDFIVQFNDYAGGKRRGEQDHNINPQFVIIRLANKRSSHDLTQLSIQRMITKCTQIEISLIMNVYNNCVFNDLVDQQSTI